MITPSEMSQYIPAAEEVLHSINYALKLQRKHLTFFQNAYCVVLYVFFFFFNIFFLELKTGFEN